MIPPDTDEQGTTPMSTADKPAGAARRPASDLAPQRRPAAGAGHTINVKDLHAYYGQQHASRASTSTCPANEVTAIIGPSGSGKSTVVRCINRMHEEIPGARAEGSVMLDDLDVYADGVDVTSVRRLIGMVFQKPNPFPTMSIFDNVAAGLRLTGTQERQPPRARPQGAARGRAVGRGQEPAERARASDCRAASSSACASRARSRSSPR